MGDDYIPEHYYSFEYGDSSFGIAKVLRIEPKGLHVLIYEGRFKARPMTVDPEKLVVWAYHMPIMRPVFENSKAIHLAPGTLLKDEMIGYEEWKELAGGEGFWGPDGRL